MPLLKRRGFLLGNTPSHQAKANDLEAWNQGLPVLLKAQSLQSLASHNLNIKQTELLVGAILEEKDCDSILAKPPYAERLEPKFQYLGSVFNEGDRQEIEMVTFDVMDGDNIIAEDLWLKASWLSFNEDDASLRFRFSFGIDLEEDVAADPYRQQLGGELTDAVFPESAIITNNVELEQKLKKILGSEGVSFVERIIYFNAPNGGAYLHHDLERGHAGVVFAQLTGSTFWLALPKETLIEEIIHFSQTHSWPDSLTQEMKSEMDKLANNRSQLCAQLDSFSNDSLVHLINETEAFVQFLISRGHSATLEPGDVLLLPQATEETCCWHSVFCLGEEMGQALSFAIRAKV
ncbi:MAG: hypothetical protein NZ811_06695 [Gammaproteobacteria bacterium]|nr:hypothetical protein [Gammaproteobacteria bacterium]